MGRIEVVTSCPGDGVFWGVDERVWERVTDCMHVVNVYPDLREQPVEGFGGAFTEAASVCFRGLEDRVKEEFLEGYFGLSGLRYNMGRLSINSCDFALGHYVYVQEGDRELETFTVSHDTEDIFPLVRKASEYCRLCREELGENGGEQSFTLLASPWSPPSYMKTNGQMGRGGSLKESCYRLWAQYFVKYIKACEQEGISIGYLTVQNEPEAVQAWDSCVYTAREEGRFAAEYLVPALREAGLGHIQVFIWDHNKEAVYDRARESFLVEGCRDCVTGVAVHWYTGDHFDGIRAVKKAFPEKKVFFTEGCVEYSRFSGTDDVAKAEMYAHDMLGNFKAGAEAFLDWNLLLDEKGGPNHAGNYCAAPVMCDGKGGFMKQPAYYYIGHFSRYIRPGARQVMATCYTSALETTAFINPGGERVAVLLNRGEESITAVVRENGMGTECVLRPHSIMTVILT